MIYDNIIKSQFPKDAGLGHQKQCLGQLFRDLDPEVRERRYGKHLLVPKLELENQQKYRLWPIKVK
jgi:hypothetical protein